MTNSLSSIAQFMDPVEPARSMRSLASQHRWPAGRPPSPLSLRDIANRHTHSKKVVQRFLFFNTYLMPKLPVPLIDFLADLIFPDVPGFPDANDVNQKLLKAFLRRVIDDPDKLESEKPALELRAKEIGRVIRNEYDIAALCEVWAKNERGLILEAWPSGEKPNSVEGPSDEGDYIVASSGLFTISTRFQIRREGVFMQAPTHTFNHRGDRSRDSDAWSNKGVLLSEIDLGFNRGRLEIYSTHLFAGGSDDKFPTFNQDTPFGRIKFGGDPSDEEKLRIQLNQIDEIVSFVKKTHKAENVAILVGDLNLNGKVEARYEQLVSKLRSIDLEDIWMSRNGNINGSTSSLVDEGIVICTDDEVDERFCNDDENPPIGSRIDYIFVERQKPEHGFILDFTRPRRRPFPRNPQAPDYGAIKFLSDHIGLDFTLLATPR